MAHHGNTPAAWTGVVIVLIGFLIGGIGVVAQNMLLLWIGVACAPLALVGIKVMQRMGHGAETATRR